MNAIQSALARTRGPCEVQRRYPNHFFCSNSKGARHRNLRQAAGLAPGPSCPSPTGRNARAPTRALSGTDRTFMAQALALAALAASQTHPNPSVGCVIVAPSKLLASGEGPPRQAAESAAADASTASPVVVGQGFHPYAGAPHAEVFALRAAGRRARGATAYVTLEPCAHHGRTPPCASALIEAGVERVVVGVLDPDPRVSGKGVAMLQRAGIEVELGCMKEQATSINREFFERIRKERAAQ